MDFVKGFDNHNFMDKIYCVNFKQFLEMKFLEWQTKAGTRKTVSEFADYIGVKQQTVSAWWNQIRKPEGDNLLKLADKFGLEVYDALGLDRPDPNLLFMNSHWDEISDKTKQAISDERRRYMTKNEQSERAGKKRSES